jgi:AAA family ATP:ADP antiporter
MSKFFKSIIDIKKDEISFSLIMSAYFFLVITTFWILKPLKKVAFVGFYKEKGFDLFSWHFGAADAELLAKVANMFVAFVAVMVFSRLAKRYVRHQLTTIFSVFFIGCFIFFSFNLENISGLTAWLFYLTGDLFSTLMVATFFVVLNDSVDADQAKRLYGVVGLGGVLGGAFGSITVNTFIDSDYVSNEIWMYIAIFVTVMIVVLANMASMCKCAPKRTLDEDLALEPGNANKSDSNRVLAGAKLVFSSKYLFSVVLIVVLYEIVSTVLDYQFTRTILHYVEKSDLGSAFGTAYAYMNIVAVVVQLFLTSFIMKRFGVKTALMVLPIAILAISSGFIVTPVLALGILMPSTDGGFAYSINQSAKETLYVPTTRDEKYKAKAFIDMFVQRFAKVLAIGVTLTISAVFKDFSTVRWLSIGIIIMIVIWIFVVQFVGREFEYKAGNQLDNTK